MSRPIQANVDYNCPYYINPLMPSQPNIQILTVEYRYYANPCYAARDVCEKILPGSNGLVACIFSSQALCFAGDATLLRSTKSLRLAAV